MSQLPMNRYIDSSILRPEFTLQEVKDAIAFSIRYDVIAIAPRPCDTQLALDMTKGTNTAVSGTLGFPHGTVLSSTKVQEAKEFVKMGVQEIDMVSNISYVKSNEVKMAIADIMGVAKIAKAEGVLLKVILETCTLTEEEIRRGCEIAIEAGADFVKTSTGFHAGGGATPEAAKIMVDQCRGRAKVKAAGGMKTREDAQRFLDLGVERLGVGFFFVEAILGKK